MGKVTCEECGQIYEGELASCPNCGCPNDHQEERCETSDSVYKFEETEVDYDDLASVDEPKWLTWIRVEPWHFRGKNSKEQACYNVLNDILLVIVIFLKIGFYLFVHTLKVTLPYSIIIFILDYNNIANGIILFIFEIIFAIAGVIVFTKYFREIMYIYWIPWLKVHRRIHTRYWRVMHKAIKNQ